MNATADPGTGRPRVELRPATVADAAALAAFGARTFHDSFGADNDPGDMAAYVARAFAPAEIARQLDDPASTFVIAATRDGGAMIGYTKLYAGDPDPAVTGERTVELARIYVDQAVVGAGVGATLLRRCLEDAAAAGHDTIWLGVWERNHRAITFYRRFGFEVVGTHAFLLGDDQQTDLVMQRRLAT